MQSPIKPMWIHLPHPDPTKGLDVMNASCGLIMRDALSGSMIYCENEVYSIEDGAFYKISEISVGHFETIIAYNSSQARA